MNDKKSIILDLGKKNGIKNFETVAELVEWFQGEKSIFTKLVNTTQQLQGNDKLLLNQLNRHLNAKYDDISRYIGNIRQHLNTDRFDNVLKQGIDFIQSIYVQDQLILSSSPRGKFVFKEQESNELTAAFIVGYFVGFQFGNYSSKVIEGAYKALQFDKGGEESSVELEKESLNDLKSEWQKKYYELREKYNSTNHDIEKLKEEHREQINNEAEEFKGFKERGEKELQDISKTYDEKLSLQSSIRYWSKKLKSHKTLSNNFGIASIILGIVIAGLLAFAAHYLITNKESDHSRLVVFAIFVSLGIWIVRILVRIFLSNLHLANDAHERKTMINTYLAMLRSGHALKDDDKQLILQVIFRPSTSGLIKDEAAPPTIIDIFAKLNGKK